MKMIDLSVYDASGRVTAFMTVPDSMVNLQHDNVVHGRVDPATEYVADRTILPRPACPATLAGSTLSGMPVPSTLFINDKPFAITEDSVTLAFPNPGVYHLRLVAWPYLDGHFEVEQ